MTGLRVQAAALLTVLALSACASLGLDSLNPVEEGTDEAETMADAGAAATDGALPLPEPQLGASEAGAGGDGTSGEEASPEDDEGAAPGGAPEELAAAEARPPADAAAIDAPQIYMALQPDHAGSTSIVFAIDRSRDGTPSDEPAIRITPEATEPKAGRCNPQQLRYYKFPAESAHPVYGPDEAARGVGARDLPGFMATAVSSRMIASGIAEDLEDTRPQNVCTRKLFEQTIIAATSGQG